MRSRSRWVRAGAVALGVAVAAAVLAGGDAQPPAGGPVLRAKGVGFPPKTAVGAQARLMAERAAIVVALRNLALQLGRTRVDPKSDVIEVEAFLAGYRLAERRYNDDGSVEATVEISLDRMYGNVVAVLEKERDEAKARQAAAEAKLAAANARSEQLSSERADAVQKAADAMNALAASQAALAKSQADAAAAAAAFQAKIADLNAQVAALQKQVADLEAQVKSLRGE